MYGLLFDSVLWPIDGVGSLSRIANRPDSVRTRIPVLGDLLAVALPFVTNLTVRGDSENLMFPLLGRSVPMSMQKPLSLQPGAGAPDIVAAMATTWGLTDEETRALARRVVEAEWVAR